MNELSIKVKEEYKRGKYGMSYGNKLVYEDNVKVFNEWKNGNDKYGFGDRDKFLANTILYNREVRVDDITLSFPIKTGVINEDCMKVAAHLVKENYNPAILNLASRTLACGGYDKGSNAQEEALCRSSNLSLSLYQFANPISRNKVLKRFEEADVKYRGYGYPLDLNFGAIYTPNVTFFRGTPKEYFDDLDKPFKCGVISVASLSFGHFRMACDDETIYMNEEGNFTELGKEIELNKIRTIFRVALLNHHDSIVLGAFGCGAFKLPPKEVSSLFKQVIEEDEFKNKFKLLVFAILQKKKDDKFIDFYNTFGYFAI